MSSKSLKKSGGKNKKNHQKSWKKNGGKKKWGKKKLGKKNKKSFKKKCGWKVKTSCMLDYIR